MRYLLYGVVGLIALVIGAAAIGPAFVDWSRYKDDIAAAVHEATGRTLQINGDLDLSILPSPRLSASEVRFLTQPGSGRADMARLGALQVHVRLLPLLAGDIAVTSMTLVEPEVVLEIGKDGTTNWDLPAAAQPAAGEAEPAEAERKPADVRLDALSIENGTFIYRSLATGVERRMDSINADVSAGSLRGPFELTGTLQAAGTPVDCTISIGALGANDAATVDVRVFSGETGQSELVFDGVLAEAGRAPTLAGTLTGTSADVGALAALATGSGEGSFGAWRGRPGEFKARLSASPSDFALNELSLEVAGTQATGALTVAWRENVQIDAALRARTLDLDALLFPGGDAAAAGSGPADASGGAAWPGGFALPKNVRGSIDIAVDSAKLLDDRLREIKATASLKDGKLAIDKASVRLPGDAALSLSGVVSARDAEPAFTGRVEARGSSLRAVLEWLGVPGEDLPRARFGRFEIAAGAALAGDLVTLSSLDARFDTTRIRGGLTYALRERPSFGATLAVDRINLDAYLAADETGAAPAPAEAKDANKGGGAGPGLAVLEDFDANLSLRVDNLTFRQTAVHGLELNGTLLAGKLTVEKATVQSLGGTAMGFAGTVDGFDQSPVFAGTFGARGEDAAGALRVFGVTAGPAVTRLGAFDLSGKGTADRSTLTLDARLAVAGADLSAKGTVGNFREMPSLDIAFNAHHADFAALAATLTGGEPPSAAENRRIDVTGTAKGPLSAVDLTADVGVAGGEVGIAGQVLFPVETKGFDLTVNIKHPELFGLLRTLVPERAPAGKIGPVAVSAEVAGQPAEFGFSLSKASVGAFTLSGQGTLAFDGARPALTATLTGSDLILDPFFAPEVGAADAGQVSGQAQPESEGLSRERLDLSFLDALDAQLTLQTDSVSGGGLRIGEAVVKATLKDKVLTVTRAEGRLYDGTVTLNGTLNGVATPTLSGTVTVRRAALQQVLRDTAGTEFVRGSLDLDLQLSGEGWSEHDIVAGLDGSGTIVGRNGAIEGFNLAGVSGRLDDPEGATDILTLVSAGTDGGSTPFSRLEGTFTISDGVVRTDNLKLTADSGTAETRGSIALVDRAIDLESTFRLSDHPEAPPFRLRLRGPWDDPRRFLDFEDLQAFLVRRNAEKARNSAPPAREKQGTQPASGTAPKRLVPPSRDRKPDRSDRIDPEEILKGLLPPAPGGTGN